MLKQLNRLLLALAATSMLTLSLERPATAAKPSQSAPTGEIYFELGGQDPLAVMNADGSGKSLLPGNIPGNAVPGYVRHQGVRWFLIPTPVEGEFLPDGSPRTRLDAVSEDGAVTLTLLDDPSLWFQWDVNWSKDDSFISLAAVEWDLSVEPPELVGSAIHVLPVGFDEVGPILLAPPLRAAVDPETITATNGQRPVYNRHDWSPDNSAIACSRYDDGVSDVFILDLASGASRLLALVADTPGWSPDGAKICFRSYAQTRKGFRSLVQAIDADDFTETTRTTIVESQISVFLPKWSLTGEHIAYILSGSSRPGRWDQDVYIVGADGRGATNLTEDTGDSVWFLNWR